MGGGQERHRHKLPIQPASSVKGRQGATGAGNRLGIGAVTATITQPPLCTCSDAQTLSGASTTLSLTSLRATYTHPTVTCYLRTRDMENPACNKGHTSGLQCGDHPRAPLPRTRRDRAVQVGSPSRWDEADRAASWLNSRDSVLVSLKYGNSSVLGDFCHF